MDGVSCFHVLIFDRPARLQVFGMLVLENAKMLNNSFSIGGEKTFEAINAVSCLRKSKLAVFFLQFVTVFVGIAYSFLTKVSNASLKNRF